MELLLPSAGLLFWMFIMLFFLGTFEVSLVHVISSTFPDATTKLMWILIVILVPVLGPLSYLFIGRKHRIKTHNAM